MQRTKLFFTASNVCQYIKKRNFSGIAIVSSKIIFDKNKWIFEKINKCGLSVKTIFVKDGEKAKTFEQFRYLLDQFLKLGLDKTSVVICIGGGSVGDLSGFASAVYLRGINFINVPTTLLAQVDSTHGGKNGIDFNGFKNQIGTIKLPEAVFVDSKFLKTLKRKQIVDGLGEIIKYGFIKDKTILTDLNDFDKNLQKIIKKSIKCKYFYVDKDLEEKNTRKLLNLGHTFGHAIELKYGVSHGKSVIIGMMKEFEFCEKIGLSGPSARIKLIDILKKLKINIDFDKYIVDKKALMRDKKIYSGFIDFPVVRMPGKSFVKKLSINLIKKY
jgi:3-dehydroquinate synthase